MLFYISPELKQKSGFHTWICLISNKNVILCGCQRVLTVLVFDRRLLGTCCHVLDSFHSILPSPWPPVSMWAFVCAREWAILLLTHERACVHSRLLWGRDWTRVVNPRDGSSVSHPPPLPLCKDALGISLGITESVQSICRRRNTPPIVSNLSVSLSASVPGARKGLVLWSRLVLWNRGISGSVKNYRNFQNSEEVILTFGTLPNSLIILLCLDPRTHQWIESRCV